MGFSTASLGIPVPMNKIRTFFAYLGGFFVLLVILSVALIIDLTMGEESFKENEKFVINFIQSFSQKWDVNVIKDLSTEKFITFASSDEQIGDIKLLKTMGKLIDYYDMEMISYGKNYDIGRESAIFIFKGIFENSYAVFKITLHKIDGVLKVDEIESEVFDKELFEREV